MGNTPAGGDEDSARALVAHGVGQQARQAAVPVRHRRSIHPQRLI